MNGVVTATECRLEIVGAAYGMRAGGATESAADSDGEAGIAEEEGAEGEKRSDASARALSSQRLRTESTLWLTRWLGVHLRVTEGAEDPLDCDGWGKMPRPEPEFELERDRDDVRSSRRCWYANAPDAPDDCGDNGEPEGCPLSEAIAHSRSRSV